MPIYPERVEQMVSYNLPKQRKPEAMILPFGMDQNEGRLFQQHLENASGYLEYGCGGSTSLALESGVTRLHSVETDPEWIEKISQQEDVAAALTSNRLTLHSKDLGTVGKWGFPKDRDYITNWPFYSLGVWKLIDTDIDLVFVDGRFRVACALCGFLMGKPGVVVGIHDFTGRDYYEPVLAFGEVIEKLNNSIYLRRSENITDRDLLMGICDFLFDPR